MFQLLPDDAHLKLTEVAEELNLKPEILLTLIRNRQMAKVFIQECMQSELVINYKVRWNHPHRYLTRNYEYLGNAYIPLHNDSIDYIRHYDKYSSKSFSVEITRSGTETVKRQWIAKGCEPIPPFEKLPPFEESESIPPGTLEDYSASQLEDYKAIEVTIDTLYLSVADAKILRDEIEQKSMTEQGKPKAEPAKSMSPKRERTLLKVIGALLKMQYPDSMYYKKNGDPHAANIADQFNKDLVRLEVYDSDIKEDTIRKNVIAQAFEAINENLQD